MGQRVWQGAGVRPAADIPPASVHQRVPCVMGGSEEVEELEAWYHRLGDPAVKAHHLGLLTPARPLTTRRWLPRQAGAQHNLLRDCVLGRKWKWLLNPPCPVPRMLNNPDVYI